ncbi:GGDEF domain-containing protein [Sulfuriflexus mobilis]|uniref:GGDEF domain-containing protein n=1 Tax=Sulfuriflexus mobilis TaxID=1811807 RepID=UPI000F847502|nr:diguanylate cyclase [Sulfuriflexus mobilis]
MVTDYFKAYAFDDARRQALLDLLELTEADHHCAQILQQFILRPHAEKIIDDFYAYMLKFPAYRQIIPEKKIAALKSTQANYLQSFGVAFETIGYFSHRLMVGAAHKWVGLTLGLYQCAYRALQQFMLDAIPEGFEEEGISGQQLRTFIHKMVSLDMTLAIEAYHSAQLMDLEESLHELRDEGEHLRQRVITDSLTGLATREYALRELQQHLERYNGRGDICLIMADIDYFKKVNDTHGHMAGDEVLREVSLSLQAAVRGFDTVSRYGGEEFLIVLSQASPKVARQVAERIRQRVNETVIEFAGSKLSVTISQGIAVAHAGDTGAALLHRADQALYLAKEQGRDRFVMDEDDVTRR